MTEDRWAVFEDEWLGEGFSQIPNVVALNPDISMQARHMYTILLQYAWNDKKAHPGIDRLAVQTGATPNTIRSWIKELKAAGLIEVERRGLGKTNRYHFKSLRNMAPKMKPTPGGVYLMRSTTKGYKIGYSAEPKSRTQNIEKSLGEEVRLMHVIESTDPLEWEELLHAKFAGKCIEGEWFALDREDVEWFLADAETWLKNKSLRHPLELNGLSNTQSVAYQNTETSSSQNTPAIADKEYAVKEDSEYQPPPPPHAREKSEAKFDVDALSEDERYSIGLLRSMSCWKKDAQATFDLLNELRAKYPNANMVTVCEDLEFKSRHGDKPVKNGPNTLRNYFRYADSDESSNDKPWLKKNGNGSSATKANGSRRGKSDEDMERIDRSWEASMRSIDEGFEEV